MTASQTAPKVFVRNATGLRKEAGVLDVFVYNTNNQHSGLGVAFLGLGIGAYAVLAHEAIIDSSWVSGIRPLLLQRFRARAPKRS